LATLLLLPAETMAQALVCATPGQETTNPVSGVINTYYPAGSASLSAGATSLSLGARDTRGSATPIAAGDLVLVIQMQDGTLNTTNNSNYGGGTGTGQGTTSMGNAGRYEFVRADSVSGTTVNFSPALTYSYVNANASTTSGQRRYQVIRVPQYTAVTMNAVTGPAWNGTSGGVVVADASGTLTLGSGSVEGQSNRAIFLAGRGFRGGAGVTASANGNDTEWRSTANANGIKGEGIAGTARRLSNTSANFGAAVTATTLTAVDTGVQGYPNGDYARGAPGNAGGGGTEGTASPGDSQRNAGGGGGGNFASGGLGGRPWNAPLNDTNGRGGAGYAGSIGFNRVLMGGGGGAGGTNNSTGDTGTYENNGIGCSAAALCSSGASGGGIVILRARTVTGAGVIDVRGAHGYNVGQDAAGGGGAGGSVILQASAGGSATVDASGGDGGNAWASNTGGTANRHGPGGGGGGGFIAFSPSNFAVSATLTGGRAGRTSNGASDTYGSNGNNGGQNGFMPPNVPGVSPGADCFPDLRLAKTNNGSTLNNGDASNYVLTVSNAGGTATSGTTTVIDVLPTGITVANGAVPLTGAQAANWACNAASNVLTCATTTPVAAAGSSVFGFTAQVTTVPNGSSVTNRARVGGGGDPNKPAPNATTTGECTGNNTPAGCAIDVDTVNAPLLSVVKTDNSETVVTGGTTTYQLTVSNTGAAPSVGNIRVVDVLPTGMSYTGVSPFSSGGFNCTYTSATLSFNCESSAVIANGSSVVIAIPATVAASTASALTNRAKVGGGSDPGKTTLPDVATTTACPAPTSPDTTNSNVATGCAADTNSVTDISLALEKDDGQPFMPIDGQTTYQFRVRNSGTVDSIGTIQFRDVLPTPMNWPAALTLAGPNAADWSCTRVSATVVTCTSSVIITAGNLSNFSLVANVGAATSLAQYTNRARIGGGGDADLPAGLTNTDVNACTGNNVPAGCAIDLNTAQDAAQVRLAKSHPNPQSKQPGETITFNLVVSNTGGSTTSAAIRVVDVLPAGISYTGPASFTSGGFSCDYAAGVFTCNRSNAAANRLSAGESATISFVATVSTGIGSGVLVNRAQVAGGGDPQLGAAATVTATTTAECSGNGTAYLGCAVDPVPVVLSANLSITKSNAASSVTTGGTVTYNIVVSNAGPQGANGASVRDPVAPGLTCTTATCGAETNGATCPGSTGPALVSALQSGTGAVIGALPANSAVTFILTCTVTATGLP
jgi:uncharacterized repeat protein (TIGR01451 family)